MNKKKLLYFMGYRRSPSCVQRQTDKVSRPFEDCTNADERDIIVRFVQMIEGFSSGNTDFSESHTMTRVFFGGSQKQMFL